jgi:hypothetical protein
MLAIADKQAKSFALQYLINFKAYYVEAYMLRHGPDRMLGETEDWFSVHRLADDIELGRGETKDDAIGEARYRYPRQFDLTTV